MGIKPGAPAEAALYELCVKYGYCTPASDQAAIVADPPACADEFVDRVLVAEGLDPFLTDKRVRRQLRAVVVKFMHPDDAGRGG